MFEVYKNAETSMENVLWHFEQSFVNVCVNSVLLLWFFHYFNTKYIEYYSVFMDMFNELASKFLKPTLTTIIIGCCNRLPPSINYPN